MGTFDPDPDILATNPGASPSKTVVEDCGKPDLIQLELERSDNRYATMEKEGRGRCHGWLKPSCIPITIILILIVLVVLLPLIDQHKTAVDQREVDKFLRTWNKCQDKCRFTIVESIPENLTFPNQSVAFLSVFQAWMNLLGLARNKILIASSYWSLRAGGGGQQEDLDKEGETIFNELMRAGTERNISIQIAQNQPSYSQPDRDTQELAEKGAAEVRSLNFQALLGAGILHTKFWVVDGVHFYLGSANMDWRSLTQVKEVGAVVYNCSCLAEDLEKIFEIYWMLGVPGAKIPSTYPPELETDFNVTEPANVPLNGTESQVYLGSSPPPMCTEDRTDDIDAILNVMEEARKFVYIAVMDYYPTTLYTSTTVFWPVIDDQIRKIAIERGVHVRLLASHWNHTLPTMPYYLNSLAALNNTYAPISIEVKLFVVPSYTPAQALIPYARVNHNKYMVTDNAIYIGTSNWSADYFIDTGGASIVVNQTSANSTDAGSQPIREQMQALFERDWNSEYARPLSEFLGKA